MTDNNSSITMKKSDGSPITFNFQLENGLPIKQIINPLFKFVQSNTTKEFGIYMSLSNNDLKTIKSLDVEGYKLFNNNEFWLILKDCYIVLSNFNDKIINEINNNNLLFCFFDETNEFIEGFRLE